MSEARQAAVLVVDDEPGIRMALQAHFGREGWRVVCASGVREAVRQLQARTFDLVVSDVRMEDGDGFAVLDAVQAQAEPAAFLFLTAFASVPEAVEAMRGGAVDYLTKPAPFDRLRELAARLMDRRGATEVSPAQQTSGSLGQAGTLRQRSIVGHSRVLQAALGRAQAAAETDADVLVEAESGTGKELLARLVHEASARRQGPFVAINCAALPEALLESELFGHARGAFTGATAAKAGRFEMADGGTLLLDEIGDMPLSLQPKLLRVLQERIVERLGETRSQRVDLRVIATTNVQLEQMVARGAFRSDLFYRLNVIPLSLPPLRERIEDVPLLAEHFALQFAERHGRPPVRLRPDFVERLCQRSWPGNIRELANFMQRVLSLYPGAELTAAAFDGEQRSAVQGIQPSIVATMPGIKTGAKPVKMDELERSHLERTLELVEGNRTRAAEVLGLSVRTIRNKIRQYDLPPRRYA